MPTTTLDKKLIPKVKALLAKLGKSVTLSIASGGGFNVSTGRVEVGDTTEKQIKITPPQGYADKYIDGVGIQRGDTICWFAPEYSVGGVTPVWEPLNRNTVLIDGLTWMVMSVGKIYTGEQIALFELQLRR